MTTAEAIKEQLERMNVNVKDAPEDAKYVFEAINEMFPDDMTYFLVRLANLMFERTGEIIHPISLQVFFYYGFQAGKKYAETNSLERLVNSNAD